MDDVLDVLFSILPVVIGILWILRRISRRSSGRNDRSAAAKQDEGAGSGPARPTGIRSQRLRDARTPPAEQTKSERKKTLEKVLARVAEFAEGAQDDGRTPGEDELYDRMDHPWPGSRTQGASSGRSSVPESHSILVDLDEEEEPEPMAVHAAERKPADPLQRITRLPPLAQGILWSEILATPVGQRPPDEDYR